MNQPPIIKGTIAYFISPSGELIDVPLNHIASVISVPEKFGWTLEGVKECYLRHKEPIGMEGKARHEILCEIVRRGWIRLRRYPNQQWSVTVARFSEATKKHLVVWGQSMLAGNFTVRESDMYLPVVITELEIEDETKVTIDELSRFKF